MFHMIGLTIFIALIPFIIIIFILQYFRVEKSYVYIIAGIFSIFLSLQQFPAVEKYTEKVLKYEAIEIKIDFDDNLTKEVLRLNLETVMYHFEAHEKSYSAVITYPKGKHGQAAYAQTVAKSQEMPHYWKWEKNSLYIYLSSYITANQLVILKKKLHQRFFNKVEMPKTIQIKSMKKSLFLSMLLHKLKVDDEKELQIDSEFVAHGIIKMGRDKPTERRATCAVSFKLTKDYWNTLFEKTLNRKMPISVMMGMSIDTDKEKVRKMFYTQLQQMNLEIEFNQNTYKAFIHIDKDMNQYLGINLENYVEEYMEEKKNKPYILVNSTFKSPYENVTKDCLFPQLELYPLLEKIVVQKNFLQKFKGDPTAVSVKRIEFSPFYENVEKY